MFAKLTPQMPTLKQRFESWDNYLKLFNGLLDDSSREIELEALPNLWVFDLMHEFLYQFQAFCQFRTKIATKTEDELRQLRETPDAWHAGTVLQIMDKLIAKSNIVAILKAEKERADEIPKAPTPVLKMMGYFSMIMKSRAHCLFGDYYNCLKEVEPIVCFESDGTQGKQSGMFMSVPLCYVTMYFHQGFAQMMMRRYVDAISTFSSVLLYIARNRQFFARQASQSEQIQKWNDKMLALLALVVSLCPGQRVDDTISTLLRDKYADKMQRMSRGAGEKGTYDEVFTYACPKFVLPASPAAPSYEQLTDFNRDAYQQQLTVFMREVDEQLQMPTIRSYLKLYQSIGMEKLARFRDMELNSFRLQLLALKHKTYQCKTARDHTPLTEGKREAASDVHFFVANDMVHIDESRAEQRFGDYFITHVHKFEEVITDVGKMQK
jgi:translation initiation factor 3 subunit L